MNMDFYTIAMLIGAGILIGMGVMVLSEHWVMRGLADRSR